MEYCQTDTMLRKNYISVSLPISASSLRDWNTPAFLLDQVVHMDLTESMSELGVHSIPLHREVAETRSWPCANPDLKTVHRLWEMKIYTVPLLGMGKHRGEPLNREANSNSLRRLRTSPAELTSSTVWEWLYWL